MRFVRWLRREFPPADAPRLDRLHYYRWLYLSRMLLIVPTPILLAVLAGTNWFVVGVAVCEGGPLISLIVVQVMIWREHV